MRVSVETQAQEQNIQQGDSPPITTMTEERLRQVVADELGKRLTPVVERLEQRMEQVEAAAQEHEARMAAMVTRAEMTAFTANTLQEVEQVYQSRFADAAETIRSIAQDLKASSQEATNALLDKVDDRVSSIQTSVSALATSIETMRTALETSAARTSELSARQSAFEAAAGERFTRVEAEQGYWAQWGNSADRNMGLVSSALWGDQDKGQIGLLERVSRIDAALYGTPAAGDKKAASGLIDKMESITATIDSLKAFARTWYGRVILAALLVALLGVNTIETLKFFLTGGLS